MPPDNGLLQVLSGGIPVALLALIGLTVLWKELAARTEKHEQQLRARDEEFDAMVKAKDVEIAALHRQLLDQSTGFSAEVLGIQSKLSERMLDQQREAIPILERAAAVLRQAVAMIEAQAIKSSGGG